MWIELHDTARDHPKILKLARDLNIQPAHALGHMVSLWTWVLRMAPDGNLSSFDSEDIELGAQWSGSQGAFISAAVSRELVDFEDDIYKIHDWGDFAGSLKACGRAKAYRERKAVEKSQRKQKNAKPSRDGDVIVCVSTQTDQTDQTDQTRPIRAQKKEQRPEGVTVQTWEDFLVHRKAQRAPVTETVLKAFSSEAGKAGMSLEQALVACISRGWRGFKAEWMKDDQQNSKHQQPNKPKYKTELELNTERYAAIDAAKAKAREEAERLST
jgi:hypothetical protein